MYWLSIFTLMLGALGTGVGCAPTPWDWKVQKWDIIVVGAGPAGIIGKLIVFVEFIPECE